MDRRLLTIKEAAAICGLSRSKFYELVQKNIVRSVTIGRSRRITTAAIDEFVSALEAETQGQPPKDGSLR